MGFVDADGLNEIVRISLIPIWLDADGLNEVRISLIPIWFEKRLYSFC